MTSERTFRVYDASIFVSATTEQKERSRGYEMAWTRPDWETFNRLQRALEAIGFTFGPDTDVAERYPRIAKEYRMGSRRTPAGDLLVRTHAYPTGCEFAFYQNEVTVNRNGGQYDFDRRTKMPYLIGKAFDAALRAARAHLVERGFVEIVAVESANPDPLAYFNSRWDGDYEKRRGTHRFARGDDGWPSDGEVGLQCWGVTAEHPLMRHGEVRYFRDRSGRLMRGRVYGGINGMWLVVYGPGPRDFTQMSAHELLIRDPHGLPRKAHPKSAARLRSVLAKAVEAENFERAIVLRDVLARAA